MIWLLFAHFIGDAALQTDWMLKAKQSNWFVLMEHCFVWAGTVSAVLLLMGRFSLWKAIFLIVGHYFIDLYKIKTAKDPLELKPLYLDQFLHLVQLVVVYL
jgi:hypothetical protein